MRYLMTQSLLSSWLYQFAAHEDYTDKAHEDFLATLRREPRETSEAMQKGIDFESLVFSICDGFEDRDEPWYQEAEKIAEYVTGGQRQVAAYKDIKVGGLDILLYGKLDCLKAGTIYDIKFSSSYAVGKFFNSPQHPMYFELVPKARRFSYLVSNGRNSWKEDYTREETPPITPLTSQFLQYLEVNNLLPVYLDKWKAK